MHFKIFANASKIQYNFGDEIFVSLLILFYLVGRNAVGGEHRQLLKKIS